MDKDMILRKLGKWALVCGLLCVAFYLLHDCVGAIHYPGYNWMSQAVSDLTAVDAPSFAIAKGYSTVSGIFTCICCAFLCVIAAEYRKSLKLGIYLFAAMHGVSAIGYSLFPLTGSGYDGSVQSFVHVYVVTILVVVLSIVSLILIAIGSFRDKKKILGILAVIALICMFFGAAGTSALPKEVFGAIERFSTYSAVIFTGILGVFAYKETSLSRA